MFHLKLYLFLSRRYNYRYWRKMGRRSRSRSPSKHGSKGHHKSKKHKKRESSSSSNEVVELSSSSFDQRLEQIRIEKLKQRDAEKFKMKERETPEEKRARRIAKKLQKNEKRRALIQNVLPETIPYTDTNNPFNDNNLTDVFIWNKKLQTEGKGNLSKKQIEKMSRERIVRNVAEMEELKKNRDARQSMKEDMEMISREQEMKQHSDWRKTEDHFHLNQAKVRSKLRIREGRAKPVDLLARYIAYGDEKLDNDEFEVEDPLTYLKGCSAEDLGDLLADIKVYKVLDGKRNDNFWDDIASIVQGELKKIERRKSENVHSTIQDDVQKVFKSKNYDELDQLSSQIQSKIFNAGRGTDVGYWESLMEELRPFMAKQRLKELHSKILKIRLKKIREEQRCEMKEHEKLEFPHQQTPITNNTIDTKEVSERTEDLVAEMKAAELRAPIVLPFGVSDLEQLDDEAKEQKWQMLDSNQLEFFGLQMYAEGRYSPRYGNEDQAMPGIEILDENEDELKLRRMRVKSIHHTADAMSAQESKMMEIAQHGMDKDEAAFNEEAELERQNYLWSNKYRPRKPRYFNRVHTGFDWNKYNQTHYDIDNPPPKIVQGYRFNIFYPDLLDESNTPTFKVTECDDPDFSILRFKGGAPYEDIAFKIVNREWEINHKHGYKCQFQNGVMQLWFFFKRYRYRR